MPDEGKKYSVEEAIERAKPMIEAKRDLNALYAELENIFLLDEPTLANMPEHIKDTRDPQPHNVIKWATDVLSTSDPIINIDIPDEELEEEEKNRKSLEEMTGRVLPAGEPITSSKELAETLEGFARVALKHNDVRRKHRFLQELFLSGFLFSTQVVKVGDLRMSNLWKGKDNVALYGRSPFTFNVVHPALVYDEWDELGVCAVLHRYIRPLREVKDVYTGVDLSNYKVDENGNVIFSEFWTRDSACKWIEETTTQEEFDPNNVIGMMKVIEEKENKFGFIPYVIRESEGTSIFSKRGKGVFPLLYAGLRSKIFLRANLFLSVVATLAFAEANKQMVYEADSPDKVLNLDLSKPSMYTITKGEKVIVLPTGEIGQALKEVLGILQTKVSESTISSVVVGQGISGAGYHTAAAAINLVQQGAHIVIYPTQYAGSRAIADSLQMMFDYLRVYPTIADGEEANLELYIKNKKQVITPDMLPKWMDISVTVKPDLPKDKIAMVSAALQALAKEIVSMQTAREWIDVDDATETDRIQSEKSKEITAQLNAPAPTAPGGEPGGVPPSAPGNAPPGMPAQAMSPAEQAGLPVEQNPQVPEPDVAEALRRAVTGGT